MPTELHHFADRARNGRDDLLTAALVGPRVVRAWRITRTEQFLPAAAFDERARERLTYPEYADRLYAIARRDAEVRAAVRFRVSVGAEDVFVIEELALARLPGEPTSDPLSIHGAVLLLDRLHDLAIAHDLSPDIWLHSCFGATHEQLESLGFEHAGGSDGRGEYVRPDRTDRNANPGRGLGLLRAWHRLRSRFE